jgi:hypothetical protein
MRTLLRPALAVFVVTVIATRTGDAAEWKIDPRVEVRAGHNDNIRLSVDDEVSSPEYILSPGTVFSYETPRLGVSGDFDFQVRRYTDETDLNDEIGRFDVASFYRMERSQLGFKLDIVKDTTLDEQLEETGVAFARIDRWRVSPNPTWTYSLDEITSLELGYTYTDVTYDNNDDTNFADYTTHAGQLSLSRILSPRATGSISASYQRTENDADIESTYSGLQAGAEYRFSETLSGSLFAGVRRSEVEATSNTLVPVVDEDGNVVLIPVASGTQDDDFGHTFSGSLQREFVRGNVRASATRDVSNTVSGIPLEVRRLRLEGLYRFTEVLNGTLWLSYYESEAANGVGSRDRNYYQIEPRFNWRFRQFWTLSGSYRYRKQTFDATNDDAVQNAAYLTLRYDWPRIAISR